jgi:hypothetical protein
LESAARTLCVASAIAEMSRALRVRLMSRLTFKLSRRRKRAKPAVAGRLERRVGR